MYNAPFTETLFRLVERLGAVFFVPLKRLHDGVKVRLRTREREGRAFGYWVRRCTGRARYTAGRKRRLLLLHVTPR